MSVTTGETITLGAVNAAILSSQVPQESCVEEVICDVCPGPVIEQGLPTDLRRGGWEISRFGTFCPSHRFEI